MGVVAWIEYCEGDGCGFLIVLGGAYLMIISMAEVMRLIGCMRRRCSTSHRRSTSERLKNADVFFDIM